VTGSGSPTGDSRTDRKRIVVGVAGGIAAYKAATVVRQLTEAGHQVRVIPTESALRFVGAATFEALSGEPVQTGVFDNVPQVPHVAIGQAADLVVVAPATADLLARATHGRADDLLTATLLTARCPVLFAPAMHTEMWQHPATVDNVATLRRRGNVVLEPASGRLTGEDSGAGRLPEAEEIVTFAQLLLERHDAMPYDLAGVNLLVTAGGTREPIDPVRFIGNRSSGRMGIALAAAAARRGADVTLIAANVSLPEPAGVRRIDVETAGQLAAAAAAEFAAAHILLMAAAPADFRAAGVAAEKIKREGDLELRLEPTEDILAALAARRSEAQTIVGFAAEHGGDVVARARAKLTRKSAELIVVNDVSDPAIGFESADNAVTLVDRDAEAPVPIASKDVIAEAILGRVGELRAQAGRPAG
jgi:phosphopantothenoylcysteine decarboxylase / phosphopantothenate---cysteine ligase